MRMKLESVIQSEVRREKHCILTHVYRIKKMVLVNLFAG